MKSTLPYAAAFAAAQLLALPGLALALYFYAVGRAAKSGGLLRACFELLFSGVVVLPFVLLCFCALLIAGMFASVRPWASAALLALNLAVILMGWTIERPNDLSGLLIWLPTFASIGLAAWLASSAY